MVHSRQLLALATALALPACSLRLNDHVAETSHTVSTGDGCLSKAGDVLDKFQDGSLTESEHAAFFNCANTALTTFLTYADGSKKDTFQPSDLGGFLTKYFLDGKPIPPGLLVEAMAMKSAFVGGSSENLTRGDIRQVLAVLVHLRRFTGALRPLMPFDAKSFLERGFSGAEFERAMTTLTRETAAFGENVQANQGNYSFERLQSLVKELQTFLYPTKVPAGHWTDKMAHVTRALPAVKQIFIAPPRDQMTPDDWPKFYRLAPRYYVSMLRVQFYLKSPVHTVQGSGLNTVEKLLADFVTTFNFVLDQQPNQLISSEEIDDLVLTLSKEGIIPCQPDTARQFIKLLFGRLLGASSDPNKFTITKDSLSRFIENARYFLEGAHALEAMYRPQFGDGFLTGELSAADIEGAKDADLLAATLLRNDLSASAIAALKVTPKGVGTVFPGAESAVVVPEHGMPDKFSFLHMLKIHGFRSLNRLLAEAYGQPASSTLPANQVEAFVADVFPMLHEFKIIEDSSASTQEMVSKRLREASLFLYASDGEQGVSMNEALEMESLLLSTILKAGGVHDFLANQCHVPTEFEKDEHGNDDHSRPKPRIVPTACYRAEFMAHVDRVWAHVPGMARYAGALSADEQGKLFDRLAAFLRDKSSPADGMALAETQRFLQLPYYVELLFSRFDKNGDGFLDDKEAGPAYPVFRPFIAEQAAKKGYNSPKDHEAIFNFLLAYRVLPTDDKWDYFFRRYVFGAKSFKNDRGQVVEIFEKLLSL